MINLANCYEKTSRYARAIIWYEHALLINPLSDDAHYGISLCYFKDDNASKALHHIEEALKIIEGAKSLDDKNHLTYMQALCYKMLKKYSNSE